MLKEIAECWTGPLVQCRFRRACRAEKLEMSGGSSAELAACFAFAALAPARTFFPSSCLSFVCRGACLDEASSKHTPSERLAQDAALFPS